MLDLKAGFPLAIFFIQSDFFCSKTIRRRIGSYFFYFEKSCQPMRICKKLLGAKKFASGLIGQANGSKVVYLSADPNASPFKGRFPLVC